MKNTLENKEKFYTQYWGQEVLVDVNNGGEKITYPIERSNMYRIDESYLELKPLSSITDEDLVELGNIILKKDESGPLKFKEITRWDWCISLMVNKEPDPRDENIIVEVYINLYLERNEIRLVFEYHHSKGIGHSERNLPNALKGYQFLMSKGYYVGDESEIEYNWVKLK